MKSKLTPISALRLSVRQWEIMATDACSKMFACMVVAPHRPRPLNTCFLCEFVAERPQGLSEEGRLNCGGFCPVSTWTTEPLDVDGGYHCEQLTSPFAAWQVTVSDSSEELAAAGGMVTLLKDHLQYWLDMREMNKQ